MQAVFGDRQLYADEMYAMIAAANVVNAARARARAENVAQWGIDNPEMQRILDEATLLRLKEDING